MNDKKDLFKAFDGVYCYAPEKTKSKLKFKFNSIILKKILANNFFRSGAVIAISVFVIFTAVKAGTITAPTGTPVANFYTLSEIYEFIMNNTTATAGGHSFTFSDTLTGSGKTLTEIYTALSGLISAGNVKLGTEYLNVDGTLTPDGGTASTADLFTGTTAHLTDDWTLDNGSLKLACATSTFNGVYNLVSDAYDGDGDGANRWCVTNGQTATSSLVMLGYTAWMNGVLTTGTMPINTLSAGSIDVNGGYYATTTLSAIDNDLVSGNILSGITLFGINGNSNVVNTSAGTAIAAYIASSSVAYSGGLTLTGTLLGNMFMGTSGAYTGGSQANGGADDYNNGGAASSGRYSKSWTPCNGNAYNAVTNPGGNWCSTGQSGADAKDDSTGLIWSMPCNGAGCTSFSDSAPVTYAYSTTTGANNYSSIKSAYLSAQQLCQIGDHGQTGWFLPVQKQLMQAYIDGSYGNLELAAASINRGYWSATTLSYNVAYAWSTYLSYGYTYTYAKITPFYVRCVFQP